MICTKKIINKKHQIVFDIWCFNSLERNLFSIKSYESINKVIKILRSIDIFYWELVSSGAVIKLLTVLVERYYQLEKNLKKFSKRGCN